MKRKVTNSKDFAEAIQDSLQETFEESKSATIIVAKTKPKFNNEFVLLFEEILLDNVDKFKLSLNDLRIILKICHLMRYGNLIDVSWTEVLKSLNIKPTNLSRHLKKLKEAGLILEIDGCRFLNPQIIAKGNFDNANQKELLNLGTKTLEDRELKGDNILSTSQKKNKKQLEEIPF